VAGIRRLSLAIMDTSATVPSACWLVSTCSPGASSSIFSNSLLWPTHSYRDQGVLDNHSAHISKKIRGWLAAQRSGRFEFMFTPTRGSWPNLVEGFFSKIARSVLRAPHSRRI
jgi:transposase